MRKIKPKSLPPEPALEPALLTVREAGQYLHLHKLRVYGLIRERYFPPGVVHRFGKSIRIHKEALDRFLSSEEQA
jgi:excisionase family DNA binding protein